MTHTALNCFRSFFKSFLLVCGALAPLAGCSTNPATGQSQFAALMSPHQEAQVGATEHEKIMQTMGDKHVGPEVKAMVGQIGARLAAHTERPDVQYKFFVLDSPMVNAFALPGGYVYVTRGLLALAGSEAEVAAVLAHEIGHITGRHSAERYSHGVLTALGAAVIAAALDSPAAAQVAGMGSDLYIKSYSRGQEHEADGLGVRYLQRAGYNPAALASFLENLQRNERLESEIAGRGQQGALGYFSTHPQTADRVAQVRTLAQAAQAEGGAAAAGSDNRDAYLRALEGVIYGDSPQHGYVRGQSFYHPEMDFTFTVPGGFVLDNQPTQVSAKGPGGAVMVFDAAASRGLDPAAYIAQAWLKQPQLAVERIDINGRPAATASFKADVGGVPSIIRVVALQWGPGSVFRFQTAIPEGAGPVMAEALKRMTYSLRPLTAQEKERIRPWRLRAVTAGAGDTVATLARAMPFADRREQHFRVLNGMDAGDTLEAGRLYKIVSDR